MVQVSTRLRSASPPPSAETLLILPVPPCRFGSGVLAGFPHRPGQLVTIVLEETSPVRYDFSPPSFFFFFSLTFPSLRVGVRLNGGECAVHVVSLFLPFPSFLYQDSCEIIPTTGSDLHHIFATVFQLLHPFSNASFWGLRLSFAVLLSLHLVEEPSRLLPLDLRFPPSLNSNPQAVPPRNGESEPFRPGGMVLLLLLNFFLDKALVSDFSDCDQ